MTAAVVCVQLISGLEVLLVGEELVGVLMRFTARTSMSVCPHSLALLEVHLR